jgi:hypothetical protein
VRCNTPLTSSSCSGGCSAAQPLATSSGATVSYTGPALATCSLIYPPHNESTGAEYSATRQQVERKRDQVGLPYSGWGAPALVPQRASGILLPGAAAGSAVYFSAEHYTVFCGKRWTGVGTSRVDKNPSTFQLNITRCFVVKAGWRASVSDKTPAQVDAYTQCRVWY